MDNPPPATTIPPSPSGSSASPQAGSLPPAGWAVGAGRGAAWWSEGWRFFTLSPIIWIVIAILYLAIMIGLCVIPVIGQIASMLLHPALTAGLMLGCRAQDRGGELTVGHLFAGFGERFSQLVVLALLYLAGWIAIWLVTLSLLVAVIGAGTLGALLSGDMMRAGFAMLSMLSVGALVVLLVALLLVVPLLMAIWFAPALVVLRGDEPFAAMKTSFTACLRNIPPFFVYGLVGLVLAILATIPLGLGWFVLAPVYAGSIYAGYKDIFGDPA
jgi:uncharacterized membrane protein